MKILADISNGRDGYVTMSNYENIDQTFSKRIGDK